MTPPNSRPLRVFCCLPLLVAVPLLNRLPRRPPVHARPNEAWQEDGDPVLVAGSSLAAIAFAGDHGYALGTYGGQVRHRAICCSRGRRPATWSRANWPLRRTMP